MNVDYSTVFSLAPFVNENIVTIIGICLLIGAMAKSSQVGQVKALKKLWVISGFFWTLIYAGTISNALESEGPVKSFVSYSFFFSFSFFSLEKKPGKQEIKKKKKNEKKIKNLLSGLTRRVWGFILQG